MPEFAFDFFSGWIPSWERLLFRWRRWDPQAAHTVVEVGCLEGRATVWMLANLLRGEGGRMICIDPWEDAEGEQNLKRFQANLAETDGAERVEVIRARSIDGLTELRRRGLAADLVYVDGSHRACDVLSDLVLAFAITKVGGLIFCDDYLWPNEAHPHDTPKLAIDAFTSCFAGKVRIIQRMPVYQLYLEKLAD